MTARLRDFSALVGLLLAVSACGDDTSAAGGEGGGGTCTPGSSGCTCDATGSCDVGLVCASGVCSTVGSGGTGTGGAGVGAAGTDPGGAFCGNGLIELAESCDPPGSCPASCDDGNACTADQMTGSAENCNVACSHGVISTCASGDGCCPSGCDAGTDGDCSGSCGDGVVQSGETCDPPASCPTNCADGNACTADQMTGSATNCNAACSHSTISTCASGDGCCPSGCDAGTDGDCSGSCGDGVVQSGETCDPPASCPTNCDDGNACTIDQVTGNAENCNVACSHNAITTCAAGDGCCPTGCTGDADNDCPGGTGGTGGGTGGAPGTGGTGGDSTWLVNGTCYPLCASASTDPDGDGWGWENGASCVVVGSTPYNQGSPCGVGTGGTGTGGAGTGGAGTGGAGTGGAGTGGAGTGGAGTGGAGTGGAGTGGSGTGGSGTGGSGIGGSGTGGSGTGGSGGCGIEPVNPNSSAAVRNVLCYLYEIYGQNVLSGQQDCHWSSSSDLEYINQRSGEYPAVVGGDFLYTNAVSQAASSWNAGGLSMIRYHMGRPEDGDSYESSLGTTDLADTLTPGTSRYNGLMSKFDHAASELAQLQNQGVVVLWAPFHETQPNGWFWWSKGTADQFKQLWQLMFDGFTGRGLNNIIWLMPFSGSPNFSFYPGPDVVDIAGPDTYSSSQPFAGMYRDAVDVVGSTMPIPLHETGTIPNPDDMFNNDQAPWVLFSAWCAEWLRDNSDSVIQNTYGNSRTINRGDLPNFN